LTAFAQTCSSFTSVRTPGGRIRVKARDFVALIAVLAFHLAMIAALIAAKAGRVSISQISPMELLLLPPARVSKSPPPRESQSVKHQPEELTIAPTFAVPPSWPALPTESPEPNIDWANEAKQAAQGIPDKGEFRSLDSRRESPADTPAKSIFPDLPAHHAGEQFRTDDGRWAVFVSDDCYEISDPYASPNALNNGMGVQTYCTGRSRQSRGDLFDQLSAYKKLHSTGAVP